MHYHEFRKIFQPIGVFSVNDIFKVHQKFDRKQLVYWQKKGYIKKIINRWYCFSEIPADEKTLFFISNKIYSPSYISFESALSWHGLIPEGVYTITSATSLKTNEFNTSVGNFSYRHIKSELIFGYELVSANGFHAKVAEPEKAVLDFFYLNKKQNTPEKFSGLRINSEIFKKKISKKKMLTYLVLFNDYALKNRMELLFKLMKNA